ncbi:hypothetical protein QGM71_00930 [Virgibacillus sp. C22-A2]|uniref:Aminoglycoside phosphotransferase domain-containing protein n=1 Tax=Virgibacillus tibetensis TaxID=3042313 RepID=A0ABU6KAW7_9BACI|nr:hypothetical protein [Virgibacillus sp. C22-A2]
MSSTDQRDEFKNRLSSFLFQEGELEVKKISVIKPYVCYLKTVENEALILKGHRIKENVEQQWEFLNALADSNCVGFTRYPNGRKFITRKNYHWTLAPYIKGEKLNYNFPQDRTKAVRALKSFHKYARNIVVSRPLSKDIFYIRWNKRLLSFKKTEYLFNENGFENLYKDIVQTTVVQLKLAMQFPWKRYEYEARRKGIWVHGDVASHNFIKNKSTYLIDFDLVHSTPQIHDYIQLGQRYLPYLEWSLDDLLSYDMVQDSEKQIWLQTIMIPSDVLREWLHYLADNRTITVFEYLSQLEESWEKRRIFLKNTKLMLKLS